MGQRAPHQPWIVSVVAAALLAAACGGPTTTTGPTGSTPSSTTTFLPASAAIDPATGGIVSIDGGPTLHVPADVIAVATTATISQSPTAPPAETDRWPMVPIGLTWQIDVGGQSLAGPVDLMFPFDAASLPPGVSTSGLVLAYLDPATNRWVPVPANVESGNVTASVTHLSDWHLFGFDPDRWLIALKALASTSFTEFLSAVSGLLTDCELAGGSFTIDDSNASKMIEGCVRSVSNGTATIEITDLRAYSLTLSSSPVGVVDQRLGPGKSVQVNVAATDLPPLTVNALMTSDDLWWSVTQIVMETVPDWTTLTNRSDIVDYVATGTKAVWDASRISDEVLAGKNASAAEKTVTLLTGDNYLTSLAKVLKLASAKFKLPMLGVMSAEVVKKALLVIHLSDLIVTTWSFFGDYLLGHAFTGISINWTQTGVVPPSPTDVTYSARGTGNTVDCGEGAGCFYYPTGGPSPWRLTWRDVANETGYRIYVAYGGWYVSPDPNRCIEFVQQEPHLLAKLPANTTSFKGVWTAEGDATEEHPLINGSTYYVVAYNDAGASPLIPGPTIYYYDNIGECVGPEPT